MSKPKITTGSDNSFSRNEEPNNIINSGDDLIKILRSIFFK